MLPNLLLIGAMKAGTTSLYADLAQLPNVFMCPEKEPNDLLSSQCETPAGRSAYASKFTRGAGVKWRGEASTAYTMRPTYMGVAERARRVLGPDTRLIYITRDPVERIVSQYHRLWGLGLETRPMHEAVCSEDYLAYSRYDWQLAPWRKVFGEETILCLRFEDYIEDKAKVIAEICRFLDLPIPEELVFTHRNASTNKRFVRPGGLASKLFHGRAYLHSVKPYLPQRLRDAAKRVLLPRARPLLEAIDPETKATIEAALKASPDPICNAAS